MNIPFNNPMLTAAVELPVGITLMSMDCTDNKEICGDNATGCASFATRNDPSNPLTQSDPLGWVFFVPPGCEDSAGYSMNAYGDMAQVMLHELGHSLGLQHSNRDKAVCEANGKNVHGGSVTGTSGVMYSTVPANFAASRSWRRDDLQGLEYLYGAAASDLELAWWNDTSYPDYPDYPTATSLVDIQVSRAAVVANRTPAGVQGLVTTAPDGRVKHILMSEAGDVTPALGDLVVDPGPSGVTWSLPAIAMSDEGVNERLFVAWMANEALDSNLLTLRTAVRPTDTLAWQYADHPDEFRVNRLAAGYDPGSEVFMVTTLTPSTTEVRVVLFDIDGVSLGPAIDLEGLYAFGVGPPLCDDSRCLIPFSESEFGGPDFGIAEVMVDPRTPTVTLLSTEVLSQVNTYGSLALVSDDQGLMAGMGERRFLLGDYPGLSPDGVESKVNPNTDWALGIGHWANQNSSVSRLFQPRAIECGNGIVQAAEECDDANTTPGDGCSACVLDLGAGTGSGTGDTGGSGLDGENGCECRASSGDPGFGFLSMFGFLALGLRVRRVD
ncbi:matrixin family metalloprotease [Enhygromyxa salina]|uniref:matrixin family metalloprotease n=1 Tax=Enhygromyxa salina TaxID=215803 RepID=UPI001FCFAF77|nr:matrixin family metalloprotease [Enhygromyxa salina]